MDGVCVSVGGIEVAVAVNVGGRGVTVGATGVRLGGSNGVREGVTGVNVALGVAETVAVRVRVAVTVSRFGVAEAPPAVGMIKVRVGVTVNEAIGVGVLGPGAA